MKLYEFDNYFPNEECCKKEFKRVREEKGITCKCGCTKYYWISTIEMYQCAKCRRRQSLRANTVMHASKLPFRYWFIAMHLLTATKLSFSALELQRQIGHKRYQPIWELMHKLRTVMGKRDDEYKTEGKVEFDEGFFTTERPSELKNKNLKRGAGSERKKKVAVMAGTEDPLVPKKGKKSTKVNYIKMKVVENTLSTTLDAIAETHIDSNSTIISDAHKSHSNFKNLFNEHQSQVIKPEDVVNILPWVHIAMSNAKSLLLATHRSVKSEYLQNYLSEFCYKFNRRYFKEDLFHRLINVSAIYQSDFEHRTYRQAA